jgi:hypothetical protein
MAAIRSRLVRAFALCDDVRMKLTRRLGVAVLVVVACTEDNPFAGEDTSSSTAAEATTSGSAGADTNTGATQAADSSESAPDPTSDASTATSMDTTGEAACPIGTHVCVPAVPEGWMGPVSIAEGPTSERDAGCIDAYATDETVAYDDLDAPEAVCTCLCGDPVGSSCDIELVVDNNAGCGSPSDDWVITPNVCLESVAGSPGSYWQATATPPDGTCAEMPSDELPEAEFETRVRLCSASEDGPGVCDDSGVCSPIPVAPFAEELCVYADGELECPEGYEQQRILYRDIMDTRGCSTCTCGVEGECTGSVYLFGSSACNDDLIGSVSLNGSCLQYNLGATAGELSGTFEVESTCEPSGGVAEGEARGADPVTLCCRA